MSKENKRDEYLMSKISDEHQIEERGLEFSIFFKKYLRFEIGTIVYLKSDIKRKCSMVVSTICFNDTDSDYVCSYTTSQKEVKRAFFKDKELTE